MIDIGTPAAPLRPSSLDILASCPMRVALSLVEPDRESSAAADTGTVVHAGIAALHWGDDPIAAMRLAAERANLADPDEVSRFFSLYSADPRNTPQAVRFSELKVSGELAPGIFAAGTCDQIREHDGALYVWDVKTGKPEGYEMLHAHARQLSAYAVLASQTLGVPVQPGGIIRLHGYRKRGAELPAPQGVFFRAAWTLDDCDEILARAISAVRAIRAGEIEIGPGASCTFCPHGGLSACLPKAREKFC